MFLLKSAFVYYETVSFLADVPAVVTVFVAGQMMLTETP